MENKKVLDAIAKLYNQNSSAKAYCRANGERADAKVFSYACTTLLDTLFDLGYKYDKDFTREKIKDEEYGEYWEMRIL